MRHRRFHLCLMLLRAIFLDFLFAEDLEKFVDINVRYNNVLFGRLNLQVTILRVLWKCCTDLTIHGCICVFVEDMILRVLWKCCPGLTIHGCICVFVEDTLTSNGFTRNGPERLRRSGVGRIERARIRTLKLTIMIGTYLTNPVKVSYRFQIHNLLTFNL